MSSSDKLVSALNQLHDGAITYGEFLNWILVNISPPCDDPLKTTEYRCVVCAVTTCVELERRAFGDRR